MLVSGRNGAFLKHGRAVKPADFDECAYKKRRTLCVLVSEGNLAIQLTSPYLFTVNRMQRSTYTLVHLHEKNLCGV